MSLHLQRWAQPPTLYGFDTGKSWESQFGWDFSEVDFKSDPFFLEIYPSWWLSHSFEQYARQIGSFPQGSW